MKKYFCTETDESVEFGDELHLTFYKDVENGRVTVEKVVEFDEDTMDWMVGMGFIEERETEGEDDENSLLDFDGSCGELQALVEDFEALEERVDRLEDMHKDYVSLTHKTLDTFKEFVLSLPDREEKKNAQPKKK